MTRNSVLVLAAVWATGAALRVSVAVGAGMAWATGSLARE